MDFNDILGEAAFLFEYFCKKVCRFEFYSYLLIFDTCQ